MSDPVRFFLAFGHALDVMARYPPGHPTREQAVDDAYDELDALCVTPPLPVVTFLGDDVLLGRAPLPELAGWAWGRRLAEVGIERFEVERRLSRDEVRAALDGIVARLGHGLPLTGTPDPPCAHGIRFSARESEGKDYGDRFAATVPRGLTLGEEVDMVRWLHHHAQAGGGLRRHDVDAVVRALAVAMHGGPRTRLPLLRLDDAEEYATAHALNVSTLAMGLAESLGWGEMEVRALGVAGLLHDIGMVCIPTEMLTKRGPLSDEEWSVVRTHPVEGARILMDGPDDLNLAALVAYEHHQALDGGGYPSPCDGPDNAVASRLVRICDVYDALCSSRPYREAWTSERAMARLHEQAGVSFDQHLVTTFAAMIAGGTVDVLVLTDARAQMGTLSGRPGEAAAAANTGRFPGGDDDASSPSDELIIEFE